ncbi:UNVERIFIED_CONTAM: hypothetical protein FKN15_018775 [Acipenser sinensis]
MAQVLEYLVRQQALPPAPAQPPEPHWLSPWTSQSKTMSKEEQDVISIAASWDGDSFAQQETEVQEINQETGPSSEVASDRCYPSLELSSGAYGASLQLPSGSLERRFPDFLEEVQSSWHRPASAPSVSKHTVPLASLEGARALGLAQFTLVDSTIVALVRAPPVGDLSKDPACPNGQCSITVAHFKKVYAAEEQVTRLANTAGLMTAYLDGILRSAPLPEPVASELRLVLGTLLQISGFQGQALGRSLGDLVVARRQLWLSQARVPDEDKSALLDTSITPGHTFGPAVEEILQCSHREQEASQQVAAMLPSRTLVRERMRRWCPPVPQTVTHKVPIPTAP